MKYGLLAAMAVAFAPIAQAQDCAPLERVLTAAKDRFKSIMVEQLDDGYFDASIYFFKADAGARNAFSRTLKVSVRVDRGLSRLHP